MTTLAPHQIRVVDEKNELVEKRNALTKFLATEMFNSLDEAEQARLKKQAHIMEQYSEVLVERIEAFSKEPEMKPAVALKDHVKTCIEEVTGLKITYDEDLSQKLDSLDQVEVIMAMEDEFSIEIDDTEWETFFKNKTCTVLTITELLQPKMS